MTQNGNAFVVNASSDCAIRIDFVQKASVAVAYSQNGATVSSSNVWMGDTVTLPQHSGSSPEGYDFRGWVTSSFAETTTAPQSILLPGSGYTVNGAVTFHALYTRVDSSTGGSADLFEKYTGTITEGDYLIVYSGTAMKADIGSKNNRLDYMNIDPVNNTVSNPDPIIIWRISRSGSNWTIYNASNGKYLAGVTLTDTRNIIALETSVTEYATWQISGSGSYEIENVKRKTGTETGYLLRKNGDYGFACYKANTTVGGLLTLYKGQSGTTYYATSVGPVAQLESIALVSQPTKLTYLEGKDALDVTGGMLELTYDDNSTKEIPLTAAMVTGFDNTKVGQQELTVTYEGFTVNFSVTVRAKTLTSIAVTALPTKLAYLQNKETLDVTGGKVTLYYDNDTTTQVELTEDMVAGFDNTVLGKNTLTVTYSGKTTTFDVEIEPKSLSSISLTNLPTKLTYLEGKDALDVTGGKLTLYYNDGTEEDIDLTENMVTGFDNTRVSEQELTITLGGKTAAYSVEIVAKSHRLGREHGHRLRQCHCRN